ncbi:hypothetical protein U9M48_012409 [Paspalum notatum var. saurae]|uniref:Uncharacterized protein n=1 Tax=Paspalum notatum var. saurae TaxID=547442 RepID=A0AAQ3WII2_PASNO
MARGSKIPVMASPGRRAAFPQEPPRLRDLQVALLLVLSICGAAHARGGDLRRVVEVPGEPSSVVWAVQLSDLHLSRFHLERAADFRRYVGDALAMVNPPRSSSSPAISPVRSSSSVPVWVEGRVPIKNKQSRDLARSGIGGLDARSFMQVF